MVSIHGHAYKVQLARALSFLVLSGIAMHIPVEECVAMADECIQLLRELVEKNPPYYAQKLGYALCAKGFLLERMNRSAEAIETWEEVANLAGQIIQDSELCAMALGQMSDHFRNLEKHDDAARTGTLAITTYQEESETRALRYFNLSNDLQQLRRYKESAEAARTSITLYRRLAMRDTGSWMSYLAVALAALAHCLAALGDCSEGLIAWKESVSILDTFLNTSSASASASVVDQYLAAIRMHLYISSTLEGEGEYLKVCSTAVRYLRQLSEIYPHHANVVMILLWAELCYVHNMLRAGRLLDAQQYIDHCFDVWSSKPQIHSAPKIAEWYIAMINLKADILDAQGCTEQALLAPQNVHDIVRLSLSTYQPSSEEMIDAMVHEARLRVNLGNGEEALQLAERALRLAEDTKLDPSANGLLWSLHAVAFAALSCRKYQRAVGAAQTGCDIYANPAELKNWQNSKTERQRDVLIRPSLFAFLSSAEANLGRCSTAVEYAHRAVDASLEIRNMKLYISASTAERSYMETCGYLADILLATGDVRQARQICAERKTYFSKRVDNSMGDYRELAPILRMLGILCCSEGHHEEGDAAAEELSRIMRMLGNAFPSLQEQVKIRLRNQVKTPILGVLEDMKQKLDCIHQAEVGSLCTT